MRSPCTSSWSSPSWPARWRMTLRSCSTSCTMGLNSRYWYSRYRMGGSSRKQMPPISIKMNVQPSPNWLILLIGTVVSPAPDMAEICAVEAPGELLRGLRAHGAMRQHRHEDGVHQVVGRVRILHQHDGAEEGARAARGAAASAARRRGMRWAGDGRCTTRQRLLRARGRGARTPARRPGARGNSSRTTARRVTPVSLKTGPKASGVCARVASPSAPFCPSFCRLRCGCATPCPSAAAPPRGWPPQACPPPPATS